MGSKDGERRTLIQEFYRIYRQAKQTRNLLIHTHFSAYVNDHAVIEIWECVDGIRTRQLIRVREDTEEECYKRAIDELKHYVKGGNANSGKEQRAG